jgi:hypothetical protein
MNKFDLIPFITNPLPIPSTYDKGFSQYETIEALKTLTNSLIQNLNLGADEISDLEAKKLALIDYLNDIKNNRKLDENGNFTGTWNGHEFLQSDSGLAAIVQDHINSINLINNQLLNITNDNLINVKRPGHNLLGVVGDGIVDDSNNLQAIFNYCSINKIGIYFPVGCNCKVTKPITLVSDYHNGDSGRIKIPKILGAGINFRDNAQQFCKITGYNIPANRGIIEILGTSNGTAVSLEIEGISIEQDSSCDNNSFCLFLGDSYNTRLQRTRLSGYNGLYIRCGSSTVNDNSWFTIGLTLDSCQIDAENSVTKEAWAIKPEGLDTGKNIGWDSINFRCSEFKGLVCLNASNAKIESCFFNVNPTLNKVNKAFTGLTNPQEIDFSTNIMITSGMNINIENCHFEDFRRAITIIPWKAIGLIRNVTINHCSFNGTTNYKDASNNPIYAEKAIFISKNAENWGWVKSVEIVDCIFADNSSVSPSTPLFTDTAIYNQLADKLIVENCTVSYDYNQPLRIRNDKNFGYSYDDNSEIIPKYRERITYDISNLQNGTTKANLSSLGNQLYIMPRKGWIERVTIVTDKSIANETGLLWYAYNGWTGWHVMANFSQYDYKNNEGAIETRTWKKKVTRNTNYEFNAGDKIGFELYSAAGTLTTEIGANAKIIVDIAY